MHSTSASCAMNSAMRASNRAALTATRSKFGRVRSAQQIAGVTDAMDEPSCMRRRWYICLPRKHSCRLVEFRSCKTLLWIDPRRWPISWGLQVWWESGDWTNKQAELIANATLTTVWTDDLYYDWLLHHVTAWVMVTWYKRHPIEVTCSMFYYLLNMADERVIAVFTHPWSTGFEFKIKIEIFEAMVDYWVTHPHCIQHEYAVKLIKISFDCCWTHCANTLLLLFRSPPPKG